MADELVPDAPDHDVLEQQQPAAAPAADEEGPDLGEGIAPDANEADAIEQALPGPLLDEDEAPR